MARKYKSLSDKEWANVLHLFQQGVTLRELSDKFGVSVRSIQIHSAATGATTPPGVARRLPGAPVVQISAMADKPAWVRQAGFDDAAILRSVLMANLAAVHDDPDLPATTKVRAIADATIARRKIDALMRDSLGMSNDTIDADVLPTLPIRELTQAECDAMRNQQALEDGGLADDDAENVEDILASMEETEGELVSEG